MNLFISAGEASGDKFGAALLRELQKLDPSVQASGIGGSLLAAQGMTILEDSSHWGVIGISQAIRVAPSVFLALKRVEKWLAGQPPGLLIAIDFGAFNIKLIRTAKKLGWKVLYFIPPGSWRRNKQGADLPMLTDAIATPFPWSAEILTQMGAYAYWVGHPIKSLIGSPGPPQDRTKLIVLPGSRKNEISLNLPIFARTAAAIGELAHVVLAPHVSEQEVKAIWIRAGGKEAHFVRSGMTELLREGRLALACSGTVTLEAALCGCPMVIGYKLTPLQHLQGYFMGLKNKNISLPNILLGETVVPEFKGWQIDEAALIAAAKSLWNDSSSQVSNLKKLDELTGPYDGIEKTAVLALGLMKP